MTLNCYKFKFSRNFALLRIFGWTDICCWRCVTMKNASEGWFSELCPIYQGRRALTFALARLSCYNLAIFSWRFFSLINVIISDKRFMRVMLFFFRIFVCCRCFVAMLAYGCCADRASFNSLHWWWQYLEIRYDVLILLPPKSARIDGFH